MLNINLTDDNNLIFPQDTLKKFKKGENLEFVDRLYSQMLEGDS